MSSDKKIILVIGATGAQGMAVIDALLAPSADGSPTPYAVRAISRNIGHRRAQDLISKGVECVQGKHRFKLLSKTPLSSTMFIAL